MEYQLINTMKQSTRDTGYHTANYVQENETLHKAANSFALATASDQATIETLSNTNATLTVQIASMTENQHNMQAKLNGIQQQFMMMTVNTRPPNQPVPVQPPPYVPQQPPQYPPQGIHQGQQPPHFPPSTPWQHYQPRMQYSNTKKIYNNMNYCWSHGHDVEDFHTSATCPAPK
eukprot:5211204-Ditylum_brightwellii.AAC.1